MQTANRKQILWLRAAFIAGVVVDLAALAPMLIPSMAKFFWGFDGFTGIYRYAMWMGSALMLGWTLLLVWAAMKPVERRFIAPLTMVVVLGIAGAEIGALSEGTLALGKALPSFVMQAILLALFGLGYRLSRTPQE